MAKAGRSGPEATSKMDMVRAALAARPDDKPQALAAWIAEEYGQEISPLMVSSYKSQLKKREGGTGGRERGRTAADFMKLPEALEKAGVNLAQFRGMLDTVEAVGGAVGGVGRLRECLTFWESASEMFSKMNGKSK